MLAQVKPAGVVVQVDHFYNGLYVERTSGRIYHECELNLDYHNLPLLKHTIVIEVEGRGNLTNITKQLLSKKIFDEQYFTILNLTIDNNSNA